MRNRSNLCKKMDFEKFDDRTLLTQGLDSVIIFTQERAPGQTFTYPNATIVILKKCEICSKLTIKAPE